MQTNQAKNNIILIGMMGSGKSTIAKEINLQKPELAFVDIDGEIEKSTQKKISEIFLKHGEPFFRMLEAEKVKLFCGKNNQILSMGGGAFENPENRKLMLDNGYVIFLQAKADEIFDRLKNDATRPLLKKNFSLERIESLIKMREKNYKKAHLIIDTTGKTPYNIAQEILGVVYD